MPVQGGLYYAPAGRIDDPPVVLIHGAYGSHLDWPASLRRMPNTRVLGLDLPGHGKSPEPGRTTIQDYTLDVLRLLDELALERATFIGHSMGGAIALSLALDFPARVNRLILIGTAARLPVHPAILSTLLTDTDAIAQKIARWSWSANAPPECIEKTYTQLMALDPLITLGDFQACAAFDVTNRLDQIQMPALIITGSEDRMVSKEGSVYLAEHISKAQLVTIPNAGHMVTFEASDAVAAAINLWSAKHAQTNG